MAEEKDTSVDTSSSLAVKLAVTDSSEVEASSRVNSGSKLSINMKSDDGGEGEEDTHLQTMETVQHALDDISEDDEDDTNLVVLDPNHVRNFIILLIRVMITLSNL